MNKFALALMMSAALTAPAWAEWGSNYNMGSIGVLGGEADLGTISLDCAESGNAVVPQGALSIFLKPMPDMIPVGTSLDTLNFDVDGTSIALPTGPDEGDGYVYEKTPETLADATKLIELLRSGTDLTVTSGDYHLASISLEGAAAALEGVEVCLAP